MNYQDKSARFVGTVHVDDPQLKLDSQSLALRFGEDNQIEWIEALTNVHVVTPEMTLDCGSLELTLNESNEIGWMEALGEVKILHEEREAHAGRLVFEAATGEYVLEQEPRLVEGRNRILGERIRFWRDSKKMVCEPSARLVIYPDEENEMELFGN